MKIRNKIMLALFVILLLSGVVITLIWYSTSRKLSNTYLEDISESTMLDAYHAFEYILMDTTYMATLVATNDTNIIEPVSYLVQNETKTNGQWNRGYLDNRRVIMDYIKGLNGHKYYISGIAVAVDQERIFATSAIVQDQETLYEDVRKLDQEKLRYSMVMMDPIHLEGLKFTVSSDYVVPAVRGIVDSDDNIIGYVILYFDYGVIDQMFSANLPDGSYFQVVNEQGALIFSNRGEDASIMKRLGDGYAYSTYQAENVGWTFHMAIPSQFYLSGIQRTALLTGFVIAIIIVFAGIISLIFVSRMTTEITVLSDQMRMVSGGDLTVSYEVKNKDEIGQMGHTFNHMVVHIQDLMDKVAKEERQKRLNEIAFLQAQINPHFISNVLNNVAWMANIQHADNIVTLVNLLNSLLQNVMHQEKDMIYLEDELEYVNNYLTIIEYSGSYDFEVEKSIQEETRKLFIPRFILQPIIENAIYHGLPEDLSKQGVIKITSEIKEKNLLIAVEDNGAGMTREETETILNGQAKDRRAFNGIGVFNVNERIRLFFGETYGLCYESEPGMYTRCVFMLPVVEEDVR